MYLYTASFWEPYPCRCIFPSFLQHLPGQRPLLLRSEIIIQHILDKLLCVRVCDSLGVPWRRKGKARRIDDPQPLHAKDLSLRVDHRHGVARLTHSTRG